MTMTSKTAVVWSCAHSDPLCPNDRFDWLGSLIYDIKPDMCIDLGDGADMRSLNTYDTRYPQSVVTQSYEKDIEWYNDSQERLRHKFKKNRRKMPTWIGFEGNHEHRIKKALAHDPRLEGEKYGVSFKHLNTDQWFNEYHEYENSGPALKPYSGVLFGHYVSSGNYGTAMSTKHHGYSLVEKLGSSATVGHSHKFNYYVKEESYPHPKHGLVVGCFKGKEEGWAGQANREWRHGVVIKRGLENGNYDMEWISMDRLEREYGQGTSTK